MPAFLSRSPHGSALAEAASSQRFNEVKRRVSPRLFLAVVCLLLPGLLVLFGCADLDSGESGTTSPDLTAGDPVARAAAIARQSLVDVRAFRRDGFTRRGGAGAGVVFSSDGLVVTSYHVLTLGGEKVAEEITLILPSGEEESAELVGANPDADVALLSVDTGDGLTPARFLQDLSSLEEGELVVAIGSPGMLEDEVTSGELNRILRFVRSPSLPALDTLLEVQLPLQQGNSGGPVVDAQGTVIGMVLAGSPGMGEQDGRGYAIPAPTLLEIVEEIRQ